jgi:hypothetical protein
MDCMIMDDTRIDYEIDHNCIEGRTEGALDGVQ